MLNLRRNTVLIFMLLVVCLLTIFPPKENLRLGRDLAGGVSLTYNIDLKPGDGDEVVDRMIQVLKERVDPTGLLEISFVRQGRDRVVVTMPLPTDEVKALKAEYDAAVEEFAAYEVNAAALERALRLSGTERIDAITALETSEAMTMLLAPVKAAAKLVDESDRALEALRAQESPDPNALDEAIDAVAMATIAMQDARSLALSRTTTPTEVSQAFRLSDNPVRISQGAGKEPLELPSARENAFEAIENKLQIDGTPLPGVEEDLRAVNEAHAAYTARRKGLDDPADLERLLRGSGVLEFRIAPRVGDLPDEQELRNRLRERGPSGARPDGLVWRPIDKPASWYDTKADYDRMVADPASYFATRQRLVAEPYLGTIYMLLYDRDGLRLTKADGNWSVASASQSTDQNGRPAIGFRMDPRGAERLGNLTGNNLQSPMAIVLDDRVMTAPNINGRISSSGIIEGQFSPSELNYIIKTLSSGSLSAKLGESPISVNNIAPELGADNLKQGLTAGYDALIAVGAFMIIYYFLHGVVALVALVCNAIIILGIMSQIGRAHV